MESLPTTRFERTENCTIFKTEFQDPKEQVQVDEFREAVKGVPLLRVTKSSTKRNHSPWEVTANPRLERLIGLARQAFEGQLDLQAMENLYSAFSNPKMPSVKVQEIQTSYRETYKDPTSERGLSIAVQDAEYVESSEKQLRGTFVRGSDSHYNTTCALQGDYRLCGGSFINSSNGGHWILNSGIIASPTLILSGMHALSLGCTDIFRPSFACANTLHLDNIEEIVINQGVVQGKDVKITSTKVLKIIREEGAIFVSRLKANALTIEVDKLVIIGGYVEANQWQLSVRKKMKQIGGVTAAENFKGQLATGCQVVLKVSAKDSCLARGYLPVEANS